MVPGKVLGDGSCARRPVFLSAPDWGVVQMHLHSHSTINSKAVYLKKLYVGLSSYVGSVKKPHERPVGANRILSRRQTDGCQGGFRPTWELLPPKTEYASNTSSTAAVAATAAALRRQTCTSPAKNKDLTVSVSFFLFFLPLVQHSIQRFLGNSCLRYGCTNSGKNDTWVGNIFGEGISNRAVMSA